MAALYWAAAGCAHAPEPAKVASWPELPPCSVESSSSSEQPAHAKCVSITMRSSGNGGSRKVFLNRPQRDVAVLPVYETHREGAYRGRRAQLQAAAYHTLCSYALSAEPTEPPLPTDDRLVGCPGSRVWIEVVLDSGETKLLHSDSELHARIMSEWHDMARAIAWTECEPPDEQR